MKRNLCVGALLGAGFGCVLTGLGADWTYDSAARTLSDGEWVLPVTASGANLTISGCTSYSGSDGHLNLQKPVDGGKIIVSVGRNAFNNAVGKENLVTVTLPETITSFENGAFLGCTNLVSVTPFLPESVKSIGEQVFDSCKKLEGDLVLSNPNSLSLGWKALCGASSIRSIRITAPFTGPFQGYFADGCSALEEVQLPETLTGFSSYSFRNCTNLVSITPMFPASVKSVGESAFENCKRLEGNVILSNPTSLSLGWRAFSGAASIHSITITTPMKSALPGYFANGCSALAEVHLPDTLTGVSSYAFQGCTNLTVITPFLPASIATLGENGFPNVPVSGELVLSNTNGLTSLSYGALTSMTNITSLKISAPVKTLPGNFAVYCSRLQNVELPENLEVISKSAFAETALESITLPPAVTNLGDYSLGSRLGVKTIWFEGPKPTTFSPYTLNRLSGGPYTDGRTCFYVLEGDTSWDVQDPVGHIVPVTQADLDFFDTKYPDSKKKPYATWKIQGNNRAWILRYRKPTIGTRIFLR